MWKLNEKFRMGSCSEIADSTIVFQWMCEWDRRYHIRAINN